MEIENINKKNKEILSYDFFGKHLLANYIDCSFEALIDFKKLEEVIKKGCIAAKATVLDYKSQIFQPNNGFSMIVLLSESHASIHTYPEHKSCFIDFFTCGTTCQPQNFNDILQNFLKPKVIKQKIFLRENQIEEEHFQRK
ncbi:MAG: S-adenosylmethionine decarboxylase proenzyme [Candidatus Anoxychlamydiales bacterium]|nr:S-adenosylmethionine decarboxylase proenzyme [Candidatus Anoxychlamydiales bacterium]